MGNFKAKWLLKHTRLGDSQVLEELKGTNWKGQTELQFSEIFQIALSFVFAGSYCISKRQIFAENCGTLQNFLETTEFAETRLSHLVCLFWLLLRWLGTQQCTSPSCPKSLSLSSVALSSPSPSFELCLSGKVPAAPQPLSSADGCRDPLKALLGPTCQCSILVPTNEIQRNLL